MKKGQSDAMQHRESIATRAFARRPTETQPEVSRTSSPRLGSQAESDAGVPLEVEEVLQGELSPSRLPPPLQGRHAENDPAHDRGEEESTIHDSRNLDESSRDAGGSRGTTGSDRGSDKSKLEQIVRERRKVRGLLDWINKNREEWEGDPTKLPSFRAREDRVNISLAELDKEEEGLRAALSLSPIAMGRLVELYNLPEEK
jgi:hypothetical protein